MAVPMALLSLLSSRSPCTSCLVFSLVLLLLGSLVWLFLRHHSVYVVDFACFRPPSSWRIPYASFLEHSKLAGGFDDGSLEFQRKIIEHSGLSELTAMPLSLHYFPPRITLQMERAESETVVFGALDELFLNVNVKPEQISVLVVNCSVFSPTPSITSMIVNRYKLRENVKSFNLSGMGCSAGMLSLDLARRILYGHRNACAVVVSTENLTRNWYFGNDRSMLVTNCLFRVGASAVLLSSKRADRSRAKYQVKHVVRTQTSADNKSYKCIFQEEDSEGVLGVSLSKDLMGCAAAALESNIRYLAPRVLPAREIILFVANVVARKMFQANVKPYLPNFKLAFSHICIHAGGKAVIRQVEKTLKLTAELVEPSYSTLHRFGNVSSSSVWYGLAYEEAKGRVKRGHKVWQIGLGSGFKCCSCVLQALRDVELPTSGCWADTIRSMPLEVPEVRRA